MKDRFVITNGGIFNKQLIAEVIKNNPEYFENDTELNIESILDKYFSTDSDNTSGKDLHNIQMGLLLGYPKEAVEDFQRLSHGKDLLGLRNIIPKDTEDYSLLERLVKQGSIYRNNNFGANRDAFTNPPNTYEQAKELFYKYLPASTADLSLESYKTKMVYVEGVYWRESSTSPEGEDLKQKYKQVLGNRPLKNFIENKVDDIYKDVISEQVKENLTPENFVKITNLVKEIKFLKKGFALTHILPMNFNPINGKLIKTAEDLIDYLDMYKKEALPTKVVTAHTSQPLSTPTPTNFLQK